MQTYIDLHRHAAVRAAAAAARGRAAADGRAHDCRLASVSRDARTRKQRATTRCAERRNLARRDACSTSSAARCLAVLGPFDPEAPTVTGGNGDDHALVAVFVRLLDVPEPALLEVIAIVMGEALAAGSAAVEAVGMELGVAMADWWQADDAFFELIRDKEVLAAIVGETAGAAVASANAGEKTKALKQIARDCLDGTNGRAKVERWVPRWMAFPPAAYTARGGVGTVRAAAMAEAARLPEVDPDPAAPAPAMPPVEEKLAA
jgi:ParB family chromosome partitioning protein